MRHFLPPFFVAVLLLWGCITTPLGVTVTSRAPKDSSGSQPFSVKRAWLFVDGSQQGSTPATVRIRRDYEISNVSLHVGKNFDEVRRYELERSVTSNRIMMDYTFQGTYDGEFLTFTSAELTRDQKGRYIVPFFRETVQIIDHEYDLVLIVSE
ncbi:MAG: hypothetical protein OXF06_11430 [Bacteroidetes bacterium]|nr:hypothetical protein [Bacteroidota bacterium]MCY4225433.1 hypothetical protein [Bacteroidota bacterium]